jgi:SAM-dependent methyltransferase
MNNSTAFEPRTRCALCSSPNNEPFISFPDIPVLRCRRCGFLYSGQLMSAKSQAAYYENDFGSERHMLGQQLNARLNQRVLKKFLPAYRRLSVLDVGCGYGFLLHLLQEKWHADVTGVELSRREVTYARETLALKSVYSSLDMVAPGRLFDLVVCFEVIEHISEPVAFVRQLLERVALGGHLALMTDNFASAPCRGMGCAFPKWIPHSHISHFTPSTLEQCLKSAGADRVHFYSYTPWEILALSAKARLSSPRPPSAYFCLEKVLATEMNQQFRLFTLRKLLNEFWLPVTLRKGGLGSLMYAIVQRRSNCDPLPQSPTLAG